MKKIWSRKVEFSKGKHDVALLWQGTRDAAQTLLLESVSPNRVEILSPEQFLVVKHILHDCRDDTHMHGAMCPGNVAS